MQEYSTWQGLMSDCNDRRIYFYYKNIGWHQLTYLNLTSISSDYLSFGWSAMTSCVEAVCYAAVLLETLSHTRTVVRECCKVDDASQWENWKFDPLPRPLNRSSSDMQNLVTVPREVSFPRMREIAYQNVYLASFWVLPTPHSQGPRTDFHLKYVKRRGSAQRCAFRGYKTKI